MTARTQILCQMAGQALGGMLANPYWMNYAKKNASEPSNGDVPDHFARIAAIYAQRTLDELIKQDFSVRTDMSE
jgi:hypothetical protein